MHVLDQFNDVLDINAIVIVLVIIISATKLLLMTMYFIVLMIFFRGSVKASQEAIIFRPTTITNLLWAKHEPKLQTNST